MSSMDVTDRGIKLLYRQRGSHLRRIDGEVGAVVIEDTALESPSPEPEPPRETPDDGGGEHREPLEDFPDADEDLPQIDDAPQDGRRIEPTAEPATHEDVEHAKLDQYHFRDVALRQLSSSITSVTSIDVLKAMFTGLFENDLIPQAKRHFDQDKDRHSRMEHKMDVRIFQTVLQQLADDFQDILDINISNNELCYQLRQLVAAREDLNQQLVSTQAELQQLQCGGEWQQLQEFQSRLNERLRLNKQLNDLQQVIESPEPPPLPASAEPGTTREYTVQDLCDLLNPHTGLLARIQRINDGI